MTVTGFITRTSLALADLTLSSSPYAFEGPEAVDLGAIAWRRDMVNSPFVHGEFPVNMVKNNAQAALAVSVTGATQSALKTNLAALLVAFYQFTFEVSVSYDGEIYRIKGYSADAAVSALDDRWDLLRVLVRFVFPRDPTPITGPI